MNQHGGYESSTMTEKVKREGNGKGKGKGKRKKTAGAATYVPYKYSYHIRVQRSGLRVFGLSYNNARCANPTDGLSCIPRPGVVLLCAQRRASSSSKSVPGSCGWSNNPRNGDSVATPMNIDLRGVTGVKGVNCDEVRRREGVRSRFSVSSDVLWTWVWVLLWP
jgi:hypothetical protein